MSARGALSRGRGRAWSVLICAKFGAVGRPRAQSWDFMGARVGSMGARRREASQAKFGQSRRAIPRISEWQPRHTVRDFRDFGLRAEHFWDFVGRIGRAA